MNDRSKTSTTPASIGDAPRASAGFVDDIAQPGAISQRMSAREVISALKPLDPVAQVLSLHDALVQGVARDAAEVEVLASALLERALELAPALPTPSGPSPNTRSSAGISHEAGPEADPGVGRNQQPQRTAAHRRSRQEELAFLRDKYGLAEAHTGESFARIWKSSAQSVIKFAHAALGALGGTSPASKKQAKNLAREALVGSWTLLPASVRDAAVSAPGLALDEACHRLLVMPVDGNGLHHRGACAWMVERCETKHLSLVVSMLGSSVPKVRAVAERTMFAFCAGFASRRWPEWMTLALQGASEDESSIGVLPGPDWVGWEVVSASRTARHAAAISDVSGAIADALASFDRHNSRAVLLSAIAWLDPFMRNSARAQASVKSAQSVSSSDPWRVLVDDGHPAQSSLAGALRTSRWPLARLRALQWLGLHVSSRVGRACAARLSMANSPQDHEALLAVAHLTVRPARARALRKVVVRGARSGSRVGGAGSAGGATISQDTVDRLTSQARRMLPLWQTKIGVDAPRREKDLSVLLADASPEVRLCLCRNGTSSLRDDLLFDGDVRVAHSAILSLAEDIQTAGRREVRWDAADKNVRALQLLQKSAMERVRLASAREIAGAGSAFDNTAAGRLCALRWLAEERETCIVSLRERLSIGAGGAGANAAEALRLVRLLRVASEVEEQLLRLALLTQPEQSRIAAGAVSLLADVRSEPSRRVLASTLAHPDARVRANTVESLSRQHVSSLGAIAGVMIEAKHDKHHRVRANAVRAGLMLAISSADASSSNAAGMKDARLRESKSSHGIPEAWHDDLTALLTHDSVMHRLAGVWLATRTLPMLYDKVDRTDWAEASQRIAEMADFDADMRVRGRAAACASLAIGATKCQWRGSV